MTATSSPQDLALCGTVEDGRFVETRRISDYLGGTVTVAKDNHAVTVTRSVRAGESTEFQGRAMDNEKRVEELLTRFQQLFCEGQYIPAEELCAECPELRDEVERRVREWEASRSPITSNSLTATYQPTMFAEEAATVAGSETLSISHVYDNPKPHAEGGLGEVFIAEDRNLHRHVALKFIKQDRVTDAETCLGFQVEAEVTGRLQHPGVVPVYGLGQTADQRPFYAMQFVDGITLEEKIGEFHGTGADETDQGERGLQLRELLRRFVSICNTIAYANNRGIAHRDIKPANIMLGKFDETFVVDWGLALPIDRQQSEQRGEEPTLRPGHDEGQSGSSDKIVGTPAYMSPEQATAGGRITPASDVYSLGAMLYQLLTGRRPFSGGRPTELLERVKRGDIRSPREVQPEIPKPLEAICQTAMGLDPGARYTTATELALDIERWLGDEPVSRYDETRIERGSRLLRRHRTWTASAVGAGMMVLIVVSVAAVLLGRSADREREAHEQAMRLFARFAAKTVADDVRERWETLEAEAADPGLRQLLVRNADVSQDEKIKAWIEERSGRHSQLQGVTSWFLTDDRGKQLARSPHRDITVGKTFAFRSYFHGEDTDYDPEDLPEDLKPIEDAHRSMVFKSKANQHLMVAFSVPVWSDGIGSSHRRVLGVLAMTVELGNFQALLTDDDDEKIVVLIDTRPDWNEKHGLVLQHPHFLVPSDKGGEKKETQEEFYLNVDLVSRLQNLRKLRWRQLKSLRKRGVELLMRAGNLDTMGDQTRDLALVRTYEDPVGGRFAGEWLATAEPVLVGFDKLGHSGQDTDSDRIMTFPSSGKEVRDTGWVVVVQQR